MRMSGADLGDRLQTPLHRVVRQTRRSDERQGQPSGGSGTGGSAPRSRYLDVLRATAIVRVYMHHALWISWLAVLFPAMWVMFALGGCLTASSLQRRGLVGTVRSRMRRLLPPLWVLAIVAIPLMVARGWLVDLESPLRWPELLWWVFPLANPPASGWGGPFVLALWYLRAYLWFVLLTPLLWWAFQRWPIPTLVAPLAAAVLLDSPLVTLPADKVTDVVWATALYGTCWILGFARHTHLLDQIPAWVCALAGVGLAGAGLAWGMFRLESAQPPLDNPAAGALWGTGYALVLMRIRPTMAWLDRFPVLARLIRSVNARALTIYVWHLPALFAAAGLLTLGGVDLSKTGGVAATFGLGILLTGAAVLSVGWVEDVAARRKPLLLPTTGSG